MTILFPRFWTRFIRRHHSRRPLSGFRRGRPRPNLEWLEDRTVPSILFGNTGATITDAGGPVLADVKVELVFWGAGWNGNAALQAGLTSAVDSILAGPYLSALSQYRSNLGGGSRIGAVTISSSSPPSWFSNWNVVSFLQTAINDGLVPSPASNGQLLYMVVPQPGSLTGNYNGYHSSNYSTQGHFRYTWTINDGSPDTVTTILSHELVESVTDPDGTAIQVNPPNPSNWNELADNEAQNYSYRLNNILVQSYLSVRDHAYVVPTGQNQNFQVNGGQLTVAGDQLPSPNDAITVDLSGAHGVLVSLNGEMAQFDPGVINGIAIHDGTGSDTVTVKQTSAQAPVTIASNGSTTVTLGSGTLQHLQGMVTITNAAASTTLTLDASADLTQTSATLDTTNLGGSLYGQVNGLAPAVIEYKAGDIGNLTVLTGAGGSTVSVRATATPTTLLGSPNAANGLVGPGAASTWRITGLNAGTLASSSLTPAVNFSGFQNLTGGSGTDTFILSDGRGVTGVLDGGGGGDWLDESAYTTAVAVNLATGQATGTGGVRNIQNVIGGAANDTLTGSAVGNILVGGAGTNVLQSGSGRSLLISGPGAATMTGGSNDDLFIAGTTSFGTNQAALASILAEWQRTDKSFQDRMSDLQTGANGLVWGTTVFDNNKVNTLTGGAGQNWFFSGSLVGITNLKPTDQIGTPVDLVFVLGLDNQVYAQKMDARGNPAWGYFLVQPGAVKSFSAGRDGLGHLELFVIGLDDRLYGQQFDSNANPTGGYFFTSEGTFRAISVSHDAANHPEVFGLGLDNQVYAQQFDVSGRPNGVFVLTTPGQVKSLQVGHDANNRPEVFVIGLDGQVYAQKFDGGGTSAGPYSLTQKGVVKDLRVASDANNRPELFVLGLDNEVYSQKFDGSGNSAGGYSLTAVGQVRTLQVTQDAGNRPELFVAGLDDQVYSQKFDGNGNSLGGYQLTRAGAVKSIVVGQNAGHNPTLFVTGLDDQVYGQSFDATGNSNGAYFLATTGKVMKIAYTT
jgi:hypothetical protein